jgi:hypothetical protein
VCRFDEPGVKKADAVKVTQFIDVTYNQYIELSRRGRLRRP